MLEREFFGVIAKAHKERLDRVSHGRPEVPAHTFEEFTPGARTGSQEACRTGNSGQQSSDEMAQRLLSGALYLGVRILQSCAQGLEIGQRSGQFCCHRGTDQLADLGDLGRANDPKDEVPKLLAAVVKVPQMTEVEHEAGSDEDHEVRVVNEAADYLFTRASQ
ncbi:hypothetical protein [Thermus scotoductus]|uniref:Uncharacterized protein n=1 Tax=Thermus scotoductus TaxID=37636 RepID=A0A430RGB1_THESC|nr:hypothetical protein [Thermus scotoductus]RTG98509.1 hypothetical protein CSW49_00790 [Thermus scotoductus]RTH07077.1 hypothetical protein CSW45_00930 [Thermus scotoductus]RTH23663.1 hypothetical protein CSW42_00415 [Thermus scotoductus]RTI03234.1 hypothetical protein CSW28_00380 [Thermus scotoductus]RTI25186.1 hypothetical protein CSW21_00770 [Thermus scotoductus]